LDDDFNESLFREALDALEAQQTFIEKAEIECYLNEKYDITTLCLPFTPVPGDGSSGLGGNAFSDVYPWAEKQVSSIM
jgi:hypothetical protein